MQDEKNTKFFKRNKKILSILSIVGILATISFFYLLHYYGFLDNPEKLQHYLAKTGPAAPFIFFVISTLNTIYPAIPGGLGNVVGYLAFGPTLGFALAFGANFLGSIFLYLLAKRFGKPILYAFFDEDKIDKYLGYLSHANRIDFILAVVYIVPGLPDDPFSMIAGLIRMKFSRFFMCLLLFKPVTIFLYMMGISNIFTYIAHLIP